MAHFRFMREPLKSKGSLFPENSLADSKNENQTRTHMDIIHFSVQVYSWIHLLPNFVFFSNKERLSHSVFSGASLSFSFKFLPKVTCAEGVNVGSVLYYNDLTKKPSCAYLIIILVQRICVHRKFIFCHDIE